MITIQEVYETYRRVQGRQLGRGYKLPKDFNEWYMNAPKPTQDGLDMVTKYFNTKWQNVVPEDYFAAGFNLWKNFSYHQFTNPKVLNMYIDKDKLKKRSLMGCKADLTKSRSYIVATHGVLSPNEYCRMADGKLSQPVSDFINNKIGPYFLSWLIYKRLLVLQDHERSMVSLITNNYRNYVAELEACDE